ncbi:MULTISPECIES: ImmA/IrrE family metallo-endopeptidase [unclassified Paenibacillus]|uniref:ImmA/IrrE family metallo-endopeptidase n=1 Tax=unclassified Paenibacillus TaxID=185978 RepID=UPI000465A363|nr:MULTISPECIES: ImmA/IrrE family metallo-endopeptidase [unclassified Paenibacillus]KGP80112.1 zinc peptidase [Paenibacillus sp. MAEPY2]KGP89387.1 zinc peptidase [Paenibacillus sp. MAEPY1]
MDDIVTKLIRKHKTNDPFSLARCLNINIRFADLGKNTRGIYHKALQRRFIIIHNDLSPEWQRFICAHELGHDRLHRGVNRFFIEEHSFFNPGKFERQANEFAVSLLTAGDSISSGESIHELFRRNHIPLELINHIQN